MSRPRDHNSISLFPFLAVLVCAMGALILLLLVTTRRIRMEAVERAQQAAATADDAAPPESLPAGTQDEIPPLALRQNQPREQLPAVADLPGARAVIGPRVEAPRPPPRPFDPNPELRARVAALTAERDRGRERLSALNAELDAARQRSARLQSELVRTSREQETARTERERIRREVANLEDQQRRLEAQVHQVERRLTEARQRLSAAPSQFVVVPYDGVSGTNRRPILIEFSGDGIRFIPENVVLRKEDFDGFTPGYNPLLAGARALVDYWTERSRRSAGEEPLPYVLLIVRPSGVGHYPLRLLLERLEQPFGYELLEEDQELALPEADPVAAELCRIAVERMLHQRDALMQIVRGAGQDAGTGAGIGAAGRREPGAPGGPNNRTGAPPEAGEAFTPTRSAAANRSPPGERRGPVFRGYQRPSYDLVEPDSGIVLPSQPRPTLVHVPGGRRGGSPGASVGETPGSFGAGAGGGPDRLTESPGASTAATSPRIPTDPGSGSARTDSSGEAIRGTSAGAASNARLAPADIPDADEPAAWDRAAPRFDASSDGGPFRTAARASGAAERSEQISAITGSAAEPDSFSEPHQAFGRAPAGHIRAPRDGMADPFEAALRDPAAELSVADLSSFNAFGSPALGATPDGQQPQSMTAAESFRSDGTAAANASSGGQFGSGSGAGAPANLAPPGADDLPVPSLTLPPVSLRNRTITSSQPHRRRWGLSDPRATIGYERELRVEAAADRLIVDGEHVVPVGAGETREELMNRMVQAIDAAARGWGAPPDAFYWIPALRFSVSPGGNTHYERLRGPLREWGVQSSATYTLDAPRTAGRSMP